MLGGIFVKRWSTEAQKERAHRKENSQALRKVLALFLLLFISSSFGNREGEAEVIKNIGREQKFGYNQSPLNIREEMSIDARRLAQYPSQSTISIVGEAEEWYYVVFDQAGKETYGYVKKEYVFDSVEIYQRGKILEEALIYPEAKESEEIFGHVEKDSEEIFIKKENGYLELVSGGFIKETAVTFDFQQELEGVENTLSVSDMKAWNMQNLPIQYLGTLAERTVGSGVTEKGSLYFEGSIPIYDIIDGEAYFPTDRKIYKISVDRFLELQNVGASYKVLAAYRTVYHRSSKERKYNIQLVSSILDGTVIASGKTFRYNEITGPRDASAGYQIAPVIKNGETVSDYGGGVCQVSSTIYAAIYASDCNRQNCLRVTARKPHGLEVFYLPQDMDATVSYNSVDFRFVNENPFPIRLNVSSENGVCLVTITRAD